MINNDILNQINIEDIIWIIFIILSILNIYGNYNEKQYSKTHNNYYKVTSNKTFEFTIITTFFIYLYFFYRNYKAYQESQNKELYRAKVLGSTFLIAGILCLLYFQEKQNHFIGSPGI